ncbi:MAG: hypothetical protein FJ109_21595, partial [Deltaproteobacteria bacterium]|nr:hypothetical protein [Deltaproteobacteria bacterium]
MLNLDVEVRNLASGTVALFLALALAAGCMQTGRVPVNDDGTAGDAVGEDGSVGPDGRVEPDGASEEVAP